MVDTVADAAKGTKRKPKDTRHWVTESVTETQMVKRLHAHTRKFKIKQAWPPQMVKIMKAVARQCGVPVMFIASQMPAAICLAAGSKVRVSAWHEGLDGVPAGWIELFNITCFLVSRSGGGKSNGMRALKTAIASFEKAVGKSYLTTNATIEGLLSQMSTELSAALFLDEGARLKKMLNQYKSGGGDDALQFMEMQDGGIVKIRRKGNEGGGGGSSSSSGKRRKRGAADSPGGSGDPPGGDGDGDEAEADGEAEDGGADGGAGTEDGIVSHFVVAAGIHPQTALEQRLAHNNRTDGMEARIDFYFIPSTSAKLPPKAQLKAAARKQDKEGRLDVIFTLIRVFCEEILYARAKAVGLDVGLLELDDESFDAFRTFFDARGAEMDELAEYNDGGHEMSALSKSRGVLLKKAGIITLSRIACTRTLHCPRSATCGARR